MDVQEEIQQILELQAELKRRAAASQDLTRQANEKIEQVRRRLKAGESTGDRFRDFVLVCYGHFDEGLEVVYRELEKRISQHIGEFILMIVREEHSSGKRGIGSSCGLLPEIEHYVIKERFYLGVLKSGVLVLNLADGRCELPTGNHARCWDACREEVEFTVGNHVLPGLFNLNQPLEHPDLLASPQEKPPLKLEVVVGDVEVRAWFEGQRAEHYPVVFQKMAQLLGRPAVAETPELAVELRRRQQAVVKCLNRLVGERDWLRQTIARIFGAVEAGIYSSDGLSLAVCETEDDARAISIGPRQQLQVVESEIKKRLQEALELGLAAAQLLSIQQLCKEYGVPETRGVKP